MGLFTFVPDILVFVVTVAICGYVYLSWKLKYFEKKGIPCVPSYPIVGSLGPVVFRMTSFCEVIRGMYDHCGDQKFGGAFELLRPVLIVKDPELIKLITVKHFDHFVDRHSPPTEDCDEMFGKSVFSLEVPLSIQHPFDQVCHFSSQGQRWRDMRAILSPVFTASKMRNMFALVSECGRQLAAHVMQHCQDYESKTGRLTCVEMKDLWSRYANDVIATAGFGVNVDSLKNPENEFFENGKKLTDFGGVQALIFLGYLLSAKLMKMLHVPVLPWRVKKFLRDIVEQAITVREREQITRPDIIDFLMRARPGARQHAAPPPGFTPRKGRPEVDHEDIAAQVMVFYFAGFETTSTLLSFASNRLAVFEEIQRRLQAEIDTVLAEDGGKITYEGLHRMKYLDMVISETLRLWPPVEVLDRKCVRRYVIPASDRNPELVMEHGDAVWIPVFGLHRDPKHWPRPEVFDPERFSEENRPNITPFTYLPFGAGPRNCIGLRFALIEVKVALVHLLSRFNLRRVERTPVDLRLSTHTFNITVDGGFWLGIEPRRRPGAPAPPAPDRSSRSM